jgi:hypothetical protein
MWVCGEAGARVFGERWTHGRQDKGREIDSWKLRRKERDGLMEART